jgi:hypothetical protein
MSSENVHPVRLVTKKKLIVAKHAQPMPAQTPNLAARATRSEICVSSLTFNDLPKNVLILAVSLRFSEFACKIMAA